MNTQQNTNSTPTPELEILAFQEDFPLDKKLKEIYQQFYEELQQTVNNQSLVKREVFKTVKELCLNTRILLQREIDSYLN